MEIIEVNGVVLSKEQEWILTPSNNRMQGVVLLCPVQNISEVWYAWEKMIKALDPGPEKVIFCENNSTDNTLELIWNWDYPHEVIRIYTREDANKDNPYTVISHVRDLLLTRARQLNAKFAIFLDYDVFFQRKDALKTLVENNKDVVGGCYRRRAPPYPYHWICGNFLIKPLFKYPMSKSLKKQLREMKRRGEIACQLSNCPEALLPALGVGMGCVCIRSNVLNDKNVYFYPPIGTKSEDYSFCERVLKNGYEIYLDGRVKLAHAYPTENKKRPWTPKKSLEEVLKDGRDSCY